MASCRNLLELSERGKAKTSAKWLGGQWRQLSRRGGAEVTAGAPQEASQRYLGLVPGKRSSRATYHVMSNICACISSFKQINFIITRWCFDLSKILLQMILLGIIFFKHSHYFCAHPTESSVHSRKIPQASILRRVRLMLQRTEVQHAISSRDAFSTFSRVSSRAQHVQKSDNHSDRFSLWPSKSWSPLSNSPLLLISYSKNNA